METVGLLARRTLVLPLACCVALAMLFISEISHWRAARTLNDLGAMASARSQIDALTQRILDAESSQRGYLITGRPEQLPPYRHALVAIEAQLAWLDAYYAGRPEAAAALDRLHALTEDKLSQLALAVSRRPGWQDEALSGLALADIDRTQMAAIRTQTEGLQAHEARRVEAGRNELNSVLWWARIGIAALSGMGLLGLWLYLRQNTVLKREQLELKRGIQTERDRLETEVRTRTAQLTELAHHLQTAREDERHRLARNLHDELGALLTSAKLDAARIRSRLAGTAPEALERLAHLVETLNASIALGRSIVEDLRPSTLANLGLAETLQILMREFAQASGVEVTSDLTPVVLDPAAELTVYRLVQEAVTNISKHARAQRVWLTMAQREGRVEVTVRDDGVGFSPAAPTRSAYGLVGMRYRVEAAGGKLIVASTPGQGTRLSLSLPVPAAETPARQA
jgi:signal transduction histidine kinase